MKHLKTAALHSIGRLSLLPVLFVAAGCYHHHDDDDFVPVFAESEPNDDELTANYFGVLRPGDRFFIDGFCAPLDLDGFAFTAGENHSFRQTKLHFPGFHICYHHRMQPYKLFRFIGRFYSGKNRAHYFIAIGIWTQTKG